MQIVRMFWGFLSQVHFRLLNEQVKALDGIKMSFQLQKLLQEDNQEPVRGIRPSGDETVGLNNYIYSLIRGSRGQRRVVLGGLLKIFDDTVITI